MNKFPKLDQSSKYNRSMDKIIANNDDLETEVVNNYIEERNNATTSISENLVEEIHATNAINATMKCIRTVTLMKK